MNSLLLEPNTGNNTQRMETSNKISRFECKMGEHVHRMIGKCSMGGIHAQPPSKNACRFPNTTENSVSVYM